jgi:septum site-determining protein MinC
MTGDGDNPIEIEGVVTALNVLRVLTTDRAAILAALDRRIAETPGVFRGAPVVIDLTALEAAAERNAAQGTGPAVAAPFSLATLAAALKERELVPVGASANTEGNKRAAVTAGLGLFDAAARPVARAAPRKAKPASPEPAPAPAPAPASSHASASAPAPADADPSAPADASFALTLAQPLRAGQIVYAKNRDAIALAAVNAGAELIADGNIHVYGPLRGRALAGAGGNEQARIYCQKLEADLVSIAGVYLSKDALPEDKLGKAVQISLRAGDLLIAELSAR